MLSTYKTKIIRKDYGVIVKYHDTEIVHTSHAKDAENAIVVLNTGGHFTATTKKKMNQTSEQFSLGYSVFQKNKKWFVSCDDTIFEWESGMNAFCAFSGKPHLNFFCKKGVSE